MDSIGYKSAMYWGLFVLIFVLMRTSARTKPEETRHGKQHPVGYRSTDLDEVDIMGPDGSGDGDGVLLEAPHSPTPAVGQTKSHGDGDVIHEETDKRGDVVDKFLSIVEEYERNKDTCVPGTEFNLGEGVVAQYGVQRFKKQALVSVNMANFLTKIWKYAPTALLNSEYFLYTNVRSMVEGDPDLFAAGNCYDHKEYKNYTLYCPYAYRLPNGTIMVKDLSVEYKYLGNGSEFFYQARIKAIDKIKTQFNETVGK